MDMSSWQNWFSDLDADEADFVNESSINYNCSFDDDDDHEEFLRDILLHQSCFSSNEIESSTLQNNNAATTDTAPTFPYNSSSSSSGLSELATSLSDKPATTLPSPPSSYILSFNNSTVIPAVSMDDDNTKHESAVVKSSNIDKSKEQYSESCTVRGGGTRRASLKRTLENLNGDVPPKQGGTKKQARSSSETMDHIMAERKRRQELAEKFIALAATIPGLKKIDKSSILSEAINYVKKLQERVRELEKQNEKISEESSASCSKKSCHLKGDDNLPHNHHQDNTLTSTCEMMSSDHNDEYCFRIGSNNNEVISQVEASLLNKEILIRIQCERRKNIMLNVFTLLTNLHFSIISNSVLPFGTSSLDITIIAEVGDQCKMPVKEVVNKLRIALLKLSEKKK